MLMRQVVKHIHSPKTLPDTLLDQLAIILTPLGSIP